MFFMKPKSTCAAILFSICISLQSCSQTGTKQSSIPEVFVATTPCDEVAKSILGISPDTKAEMMKWSLTLYRDSNSSTLTAFKLSYTYGMAKQGTRSFMPGATTVDLQGKCNIQDVVDGKNQTVVQLTSQNPALSLSFWKPNEKTFYTCWMRAAISW
jgi:hypothetical protein